MSQDAILTYGMWFLGIVVIPLSIFMFNRMTNAFEGLKDQFNKMAIEHAVQANSMEALKLQITEYIKANTDEMKSISKSDVIIGLLDSHIKNLESRVELAFSKLRELGK